MSSLGLSSSALAETIAETVLEGFNKHFRIFQKITAGAMGRYETEDWMAERDASRKRMLFYDKRADEAVETLREIFGQALNDMAVWKQVKVLYIML
ncbi:MAG: bifunctional isocitrate dehydrogenase kinase/phosphatase, partial [Chromatiales bacterium]